MKIVIITKKIWDLNNLKNFKFKNKIYNHLTEKIIKNKSPKKIFFIHWSKFIPKKIYNKFECIQFHCSDLPKFRGGTPIQNQIIRGIKNTKLSAFRVSEKIDTGPIYLKKNISLSNNASKIYSRIEKKSFEMIQEIIKKEIKPKKQRGVVTTFKRRKSNQSIINKKINTMNKIYDFIRMLDAENYPKANIKLNNFVCEFYDSKLINNCVYGKFKIKKK